MNMIIDINEFKLKEGENLKDFANEVLNTSFKELGGVQMTGMLYNNVTNKGIFLSPNANFLNYLSTLSTHNKINADIVMKQALLTIIKNYVEEENPDEYIFFAEMWFKSMSEEEKSNYKQGDLVKDLNSKEGILYHYETKVSFESITYEIQRKYEKGKVMKLIRKSTNKDKNATLQNGNLTRILYED